MAKLGKKIVFALLPCVVLLGLTEIGLRLAGFRFAPRQKELFKPTVAAFYGTMQPYWPVEFDPPGYLWLRNTHIARQNPEGGREYVWPIPKAPDRIRVAFVGGSTVESHPGSMFESFPELCVALLNQVAGTNRYEALNVGCSSYTTHQSLLAVERYVLPRHPDVVVLYDGWNDFSVRDGYSDREKDFWMRASLDGKQAGALAAWARGLRLAQLLGLAAQKLDVGWPRPRCDAREFRANLEKAARLVAAAGAQPVVVLKPVSRKQPVNNWTGTPEMIRVFGPDLGPTSEAIYRGIHRYATDAQRAIVSNLPGARLADVEGRLNRAQDDLAEAPEGVTVFITDAMHCSALGNYFVAEAVAEVVAPELAERVRAYAASAANWRRMAENLERIQSPFEAAFAARRAVALDPALGPALAPLMERAEREFEFKRLFDRGRWDNGLDLKWEERMDLLRKCLRLRPGDLGVALQVMRASMYMGHMVEVARLLADFQPADARDRLEWLGMCFQSHLAGNRLAEAEWTATQMLALEPGHAGARDFLERLRQYRQSGR